MKAKIKTDQSTNHRNMIIIFEMVIFLAFIMESYVAVKMSERMDALEEANSSLQQQINDFYGDQPISLDTNSICSYFSGYISDIKKDSYNINIDLILKIIKIIQQHKLFLKRIKIHIHFL